MNKATLELGQAMFGQPTHMFECPEYVVEFIRSILMRLEQKTGLDP